MAFVVPKRAAVSAEVVERARALLREHARGGFCASAADIAAADVLRDQVDVLAAQLHALLSTNDPELQRPLLEAVLFCADGDDVGAKPGETIVLLHADGRSELRRKAVSAADVAETRAALAACRRRRPRQRTSTRCSWPRSSAIPGATFPSSSRKRRTTRTVRPWSRPS